jgi:hypothetical protein
LVDEMRCKPKGPPGRAMAMESAHSLTERTIRNISWGNDGRCLGLTTLPSSCAVRFEILGPQPPGALRVTPGLYRFCLTCTTGSTYLGQV